MRSNLLIIDLNNCVYGILFRKTFPFPVCTTLYPTFIESGFKLRSLTKFDLKFLQCDKYDCICILLYKDIQVDQYHLLKVLPFSGLYIKNIVYFCHLYSKHQISIHVCINNYVWSPIMFFNKTVFMLIISRLLLI